MAWRLVPPRRKLRPGIVRMYPDGNLSISKFTAEEYGFHKFKSWKLYYDPETKKLGIQLLPDGRGGRRLKVLSRSRGYMLYIPAEVRPPAGYYWLFKAQDNFFVLDTSERLSREEVWCGSRWAREEEENVVSSEEKEVDGHDDGGEGGVDVGS